MTEKEGDEAIAPYLNEPVRDEKPCVTCGGTATVSDKDGDTDDCPDCDGEFGQSHGEKEKLGLPWQYQERSDAYTHIVRANDEYICSAPQGSRGMAETHARFIVKAANAHHALVEALEASHACIAEFWPAKDADTVHDEEIKATSLVIVRNSAALKLAKGES